MPATILRPILKIPINNNVEQLKIVLIYPVQDMGGASKSLMSKNVHIIYAQKIMDSQEGFLTLSVKLSIIYKLVIENKYDISLFLNNVIFFLDSIFITVPIPRIISVKNVRAWVSMVSYLKQIRKKNIKEKKKILRVV